MSVLGEVFEEFSSNGGATWQLRIPLPEGQYINFVRDLNSELNPLILSAFVSSVDRGLRSSLAEGLRARPARVQPELIRRPVTAELYHVAGAGSASGD